MKNTSISQIYSTYVMSLVFLTYGVFGISWSATGALMGDIIKELNISLAEGSFLTSAITLAKILGAICSGIIVAKMGLKKAFTLGSLLISLSVLSGFATSFSSLFILRFAMGLGSAICLVCLVPMCQAWILPENQQKVNGINGISNILGTIIALLVTAPLTSAFGSWRLTLSFYGVISLMIAVLFTFTEPSSKEKIEVADNLSEDKHSLYQSLKDSLPWGMFLFYVFPILMINVSFTYFPLYFQEHMQTDSWLLKNTGMVVNLGFMLGILMSGRFRKYLSINSLLWAVIIMFILTSLLFIVHSDIFVPLCAFFAVFPMGVIFGKFISLPIQIYSKNSKQTSYTMSLFWCLNFAVATLNLWIMGKIVDISHSFVFAFGYMCMMVVPSIIGYVILMKKVRTATNLGK